MWQVKFRTKIFGGFLFLIILSSIMAYLGWHNLRALQETVERQQTFDFITKTLLDTRRQEKNFLLRGGQEYLSQVTHNLQAIKDRVAQARAVLADPADQQYLNQVLDDLGSYEAALDRYVLHRQQRTQQAMDRQRRLSQLEQEMVTPVRKLLKASEEAQETQRGQIQSQLASANRLMGVSVVFAIALGILVSVALVRALTKTLNRIIYGLGEGPSKWLRPLWRCPVPANPWPRAPLNRRPPLSKPVRLSRNWRPR
jgi:CHASE3 domain sensor protein